MGGGDAPFLCCFDVPLEDIDSFLDDCDLDDLDLGGGGGESSSELSFTDLAFDDQEMTEASFFEDFRDLDGG